ncbi:MAG: 50S ribosomal protein L11 methyltransferase [Kineosporiaceae bacterium]
MDADRHFVTATTTVGTVPFVPQVRLHLADDALGLWERTEERAGTPGQPPPFWAFAWAGGQALARYVADHPDVVAARSVLDFAAGSGLVAVAAARAGAARVVAAEIDPLATAAVAANARLNDVDVHPLLGDVTTAEGERELHAALGGRPDVVLAGDVFYDRAMVAAVLPFLQSCADAGATVLVGDPGRAYLPQAGLTELVRYQVPVMRTLEDRDVRSTGVLRLNPR